MLRPTYPIRTERLVLRPLVDTDVDALAAYQAQSDVCRYVPYESRGADVLAGRVVHPDRSGRGYVAEAGRALLALAFDGLGAHRVIARIDARNEASAAVARRLGMRQEAHLRENEWFKGEWSDELDFAILADEWRDPQTDS